MPLQVVGVNIAIGRLVVQLHANAHQIEGFFTHDLIDGAQKHFIAIRIEQLYPLPTEQLLGILANYPNAKELRWLQEEPANMGAWNFIEHNTWRIKDEGYDLRHVTRVESGSPATGSKKIHDQELAELMDRVFRPAQD